MDRDEEFQLDVVQRLARIETKMDTQNGIVKKNCEDIVVLQKKSITHDAQWSLIKKLSAVIASAIGIAATVLPILISLKVI